MTVLGNGQPAAFKVIVSQHFSQQAKLQYDRAKGQGLGSKFLDALAKIEFTLARTPREFGEPMSDLSEMQIRHGVILPVVVEYGVHAVQPLVFLRRIAFLPPGK